MTTWSAAVGVEIGDDGETGLGGVLFEEAVEFASGFDGADDWACVSGEEEDGEEGYVEKHGLRSWPHIWIELDLYRIKFVVTG